MSARGGGRWLARLLRGVVLALPLCAGCWALAQDDGWSVQTVALRDLREAERVAAALRYAGFPAFTEFAMTDGLQYVRVRVGCWSSRDGADGVAALLLAGAYAREAVVVPQASRPPWGCTEVDVGFLTPSNWSALHASDEIPTFRVELAGHVGHLRHAGDRWQVLQGDARPDPVAVEAPAWAYRDGELGGGAVVFDDRGAAPVLVCPGTLIGQVEDVAIVTWEDAVVACRPAARPHDRP